MIKHIDSFDNMNDNNNTNNTNKKKKKNANINVNNECSCYAAGFGSRELRGPLGSARRLGDASTMVYVYVCVCVDIYI